MNSGILTPPNQYATLPRGLLGKRTPVPLTARLQASHMHLESLAWQSAVRANGGDVSDETLRAVSNLCWAIDAANIRDRFYRLNLFAGSNLSAALVPLYTSSSPGGLLYGTSTDTNVNFVNADYTERGVNGGLNSATTTKRLNTGFIPTSTDMCLAGHLAVYRTATTATAGGTLIGWSRFSPTINVYEILDNGARYDTSWGSNQASPLVRRVDANLVAARVNSATSFQLYDNTVLVAGGPVSSVDCNTSILVFAQGRGGGAANPISGRIRSYSFGNGMTATQVQQYSDIIDAFHLAMGRVQ